MNITRKMLSNGHCESFTIQRGDLEYKHQLYIEHGAYFIRLIIREDGYIIVDRSYVERVCDTTFSSIKALFKECIAWTGLGMLYSFSHNGVRYDVITDGIDHARNTISKMYGMYAEALESLIQ